MVCTSKCIDVDEQYYDIVCIEPKSGNLVYIDKGYTCIIYSLQVPFIKRWTLFCILSVFKIK